MTVDEILADYNLEKESILAALDYGGQLFIHHDFEGEECYLFTLVRCMMWHGPPHCERAWTTIAWFVMR